MLYLQIQNWIEVSLVKKYKTVHQDSCRIQSWIPIIYLTKNKSRETERKKELHDENIEENYNRTKALTTYRVQSNESLNLQLTFFNLCNKFKENLHVFYKKGLSTYNAASGIQVEASKVYCYTCLPIDKNNIILAFQV